MRFIDKLCCDHEWNVLNEIIEEPCKRPIEASYVTADFIRKLVSGITQTTYTCTKCGKLIFKETIGIPKGA